MPRPFRRNHNDINILWRNDILEMYIKSMTKAEGLACLEIWRYLCSIDFALNFVRQGNNDEGCPVHCGFNIAWRKAVRFCQFKIIRSRKLGNSHFDAAVSEILAVGMTLTAITDNRYFFTLQRTNRRISFVINLCHFAKT